MSKLINIRLVVIFAVCFCLAGCVQVGDIQEETRSIEAENVDTAEIELNLGAGEIRVQGGTTKLFEGIFTYNVEKWKPLMDYRTRGSKGVLNVSQGRTSGIPAGKGKNNWDIYLNEDIPLELVLDFGAGEGKLDLKGLNLKSLEIDMGVGDLTVDLAGSFSNNLDVIIDGGVGSATVYIPREVGVRIMADKGIGSIDARGLNKRGDFYTNEVYGSTEFTINIEIETGIGSIELKLK